MVIAKPFRALVVLAAVTAGVAAVSSCGAPGPAAAEPSSGCAVWDRLVEKVVGASVNELGGPHPALGDSSAYVAELRDATGAKVGSITGRTDIAHRLAGGGLQEHLVETVELPGGTILAQGVYDPVRKAAGDRQRVGVVGTRGGYTGHLGDRYAQAVGPDEFAVRIEMCPPGMLRSGR
ncbi:allene oxide cyclase barrel-like domain-containing protein [Actinokineospora inagensis]|uniref:allene oxide cyclase barrel-like domain-containing protein n=1 Tax=Actinokineospora inagensis TaxID=103730 RepID=UPI0004088EEA|nr:hypothetical protein [Actinokineospora inagensis]